MSLLNILRIFGMINCLAGSRLREFVPLQLGTSRGLVFITVVQWVECHGLATAAEATDRRPGTGAQHFLARLRERRPRISPVSARQSLLPMSSPSTRVISSANLSSSLL